MSKDSILVVEESLVLSDLIRDLLEATGFSVVQASTSKDGLALLKESVFLLALIDADMPGIAGAEANDLIKSDALMSRTPVMIIVGGDLDEASLPVGLTASECVRKPIDPVELIVRVRSAAGRGGHVPSINSAGDRKYEPVVKLSNTPGEGKVITVFSLKGGVGTSTIAANLAVALQKLWNEATALIDLSLEAGGLNILLDIMPTATLDELMSENGNMSAESVTQYLIPHKSGVSLLSAPPSPERAELVDGATLRKAMNFLREKFDYVVIDTASTFAEHTLLSLEIADHIILPIVGDISSVRATTTALDIFQALNIPDDRVMLVFNEIFPKMGLSRKHAETSIHLTARPIPFGGPKLLDSINLGTPIVMTDPDNAFSQAVEEIAFEVSHPDSELRAEPKTTDLLSKMRKRLKV